MLGLGAATTVAAAAQGAATGAATDRFIQDASEVGEKSPELDAADRPQPSADDAFMVPVRPGWVQRVSPHSPGKYPDPATGLLASSPTSVSVLMSLCV